MVEAGIRTDGRTDGEIYVQTDPQPGRRQCAITHYTDLLDSLLITPESAETRNNGEAMQPAVARVELQKIPVTTYNAFSRNTGHYTNIYRYSW